MTSLHDWQIWEPLVDALRASAPPGTRRSVFEGAVSPQAWGGGFSDDGDHDRRRALERERAREAAAAARAGRPVPGPRAGLDAAFETVRAAVPPEGISVVVHACADRDEDLVRLLTLPPYVRRGLSGAVEEVVLVEGALPAPHTATISAAPGTTVAPSADPAGVERVVRERLPDASGADDDQLAAAEALLGVALPEEVRALYRAAAEGDLVLGDEGGFYGFGLIPLADCETRAAYLPDRRFMGWTLDADALPPVDPDDRVQAAIGSPLWLPVGHDWGGNVYAVDLAPGPRGYVGQVVYLDHEQTAGARLVADSLAQLLVEGTTASPPLASETRVARLNPRDGTDVAARVDAGTEVIVVGAVDAPVDLEPVLGHPRVRVLDAATTGSLADRTQVASFPALEFLALSPADWRALLATGAVPDTLRAAGFGLHAAELDESVEAANLILARFGREPVSVTELRRPPRRGLLSRLLGLREE
ncbi:SMI1/KNR4 family protein [Antribacter gilvus]|uniref:SMI1/KNR4 family protein n=1 Tax=Antribacter gilvus TaxID=2304675 RepID=UPI0013DFB9C7|nr:SMI1/KNR4 family protein [Antribacter gilvus]